MAITVFCGWRGASCQWPCQHQEFDVMSGPRPSHSHQINSLATNIRLDVCDHGWNVMRVTVCYWSEMSSLSGKRCFDRKWLLISLQKYERHFWDYLSNSDFLRWQRIHEIRETSSLSCILRIWNHSSFAFLLLLHSKLEAFSHFSHYLSTAACASGKFIACGRGGGL